MYKVNNSSIWSRSTDSARHIISKILVSLSSHAARNPKTYITIIPLLSSALLGIGFLTNFRLELDQSEVYPPFNSRSVQHKNYFENPNSEWPKPGRRFYLLVHADGDNVLRRDAFRQVFKAIDIVKETPGYTEICSKGNYMDPYMENLKTCEISSITRFWENNLTVFDNEIESDESLYRAVSNLTYFDGTPVDFEVLFGSPDIDHIRGLFTIIYIPDTNQTKKFEEDVVKNIFALQAQLKDQNATVKVEVLAKRSYNDEYLRSIFIDLPLLPFAVGLMVFFTFLVFYRKHPVQSRCTLGVGSVVTIVLSLATGFGIMFIIGKFGS